MRTYAAPLLSALLAISFGCASAAAQGAPSDGSKRVGMSATMGGSADSLYAAVKSRLQRLHYRFDQVEDGSRRVVVRAPKDKTKVAVSVITKGDSSSLSVVPIDAADLVSSMRSLLTVTYDATNDSTPGKAPAPESSP
jgi:hypothetical protein